MKAKIVILLILPILSKCYNVHQQRECAVHQSLNNQHFTRRDIGNMIISIVTIPNVLLLHDVPLTNAAETVGKDPLCNTEFCLGVWDGILANCQHPTTNYVGCVSSQDDTPDTFAEPWDYSDDMNYMNSTTNVTKLMQQIIEAINTVCNKRGDTVEIKIQDQRYLRVLFIDQPTLEQSDGEFYITPNDTTIQFRIASRNESTIRSQYRPRILVSSSSSSIRNIDRAELIRKELRFLKLPIFRNRQRSLFFIESDFDTFGPGSAMLGPPEEMK